MKRVYTSKLEHCICDLGGTCSHVRALHAIVQHVLSYMSCGQVSVRQQITCKLKWSTEGSTKGTYLKHGHFGL